MFSFIFSENFKFPGISGNPGKQIYYFPNPGKKKSREKLPSSHILLLYELFMLSFFVKDY
jgi:hypothetical protein